MGACFRHPLVVYGAFFYVHSRIGAPGSLGALLSGERRLAGPDVRSFAIPFFGRLSSPSSGQQRELSSGSEWWPFSLWVFIRDQDGAGVPLTPGSL